MNLHLNTLSMIRNTIILLVIFAATTMTSKSQPKPTDPYAKEWKDIDSLVNQGLPKSAAEIARTVLASARQKQESAQAIKAQLFLLGADDYVQEGAEAANIQHIDSMIQVAQGAEKAIWQSIQAELYWDYYQQNRWTIWNRTPVAGELPADIAAWDGASLIRKASELYQASVADGETLQAIPVERYTPLLTEGVNTRHLRPTLYDFLAFRAIGFFENDQKDLIKPAYQFQIADETWFQPATDFTVAQLASRDSESLHFQALLLYQQLLAFHVNDPKPDALIDADLRRLSFVYQYSIHPDKDSLYRDALQQLAARYPNEPAVAQVHYQTFQWQYDKALENPSDSIDLVGLVAELDALIERFPRTEGGTNAAVLRHSIQSKSLNVQAESVVLPQQNSKVLLTYRNLSHVFFSLYAIPAAEHRDNVGATTELQERILSRTPVRTWETTLPGTVDHREHNTEIKIDPLSAGSYILVASAYPTEQRQSNVMYAVPFQVSALSLLSLQAAEGSQFLALHRQSGMPIRGAAVTFWNSQWNNRTNEYEYVRGGQSRTDEDGRVHLPRTDDRPQRINRITLVQGTDTLQSDSYYQTGRHTRNPDSVRTHTFFFTDRAIYRPGQTIHFKGIIVDQHIIANKNEVRANEKSKVTLYDANRQAVAEIDVVTNEYGSFAGKFIAPSTGMTGPMRIANPHGNGYFSVEEYKRPRFRVEFDTVRRAAGLDEEIVLTGRASAYAGNSIDGAQVSYRVVRRARFPFFWSFFRWGQPFSSEMEIANGTLETRPDGSFDVTVATIPDKQIAPESLPVFSYTVYADVTDRNGETQSGSTQLHAGYRSLQLHTDLPEQLDARKQDNSLSIIAQNLNGLAVPTDVEVSVAPLQFPGKLYRERLWDKPDRPSMDEATFRQAFPEDEYNDESDYRNWPEMAPTWQTTVNTGEETTVKLPAEAWLHTGWHVVQLKSMDPQGREILDKKYTYIHRPGTDQVTQAALSVLPERTALQPGDTLRIDVRTGFENTYVLESSTDLQNEFVTFAAQKTIDRPITEPDRGGVSYQWLYVHNNRVYTATWRIDVAWSNRDLRIEWATHRDKLLPGEPEQWLLTIKGDKKEAVAAELLAGLYDASLDALRRHSWQWNPLSPFRHLNTWTTQSGFGTSYGTTWNMSVNSPHPPSYDKRYDYLFGYHKLLRNARAPQIYVRGVASNASADMVFESAAAPVAEETAVVGYGQQAKQALTGSVTRESEEAPPAVENIENVPVRTNLQETAFFFPQLKTDAEGNVTLAFTMPEALTEWKFMAFAHTPDWKTGFLQGQVKTQKDLMVMPNLPRFLRQGDAIRLGSKISNISATPLDGTAQLEILDAETLEPIPGFGDGLQTVSFQAPAGQSTSVSWLVDVPETWTQPVTIRVRAKAGNFTDGEEHILPVISNRMLVTETLPLPVRGNERKAFTLDKLAETSSDTRINHALTVEFTSNPAWYAVQALPYLMDYPYECAEQIFSRFYANALASHIVSQSPRVKAIFDQWLETDTAALLSNLEKNQELKSALLEETPWVMEAQNESEQKRRIALLFDSHKLTQGLRQNLDKLAELQSADGSFPWFMGMSRNRYITQHIATGIAKLQQLGVAAASEAKAHEILEKAVAFLDSQTAADYTRLIQDNADLNKQQLSNIHVHYLYMRSFLRDLPIQDQHRNAHDYYLNQAGSFWVQFNAYLQGQAALALHRSRRDKSAQTILASLRETAINDPELGMFWKTMPRGYWWHEAPIEAQSVLVEAFAEIANDMKAVDEMKVWLIKQKQTQHWNSTKATADAIYALLLQGSDWLAATPTVTLTLGNETIRSADEQTEAGTGYFKKRYEGDAVTPAMGNITVAVDRAKDEGVAWGAVYWQYFEQLDQITPAATPLSLRRQLFIERHTDRGPVLTEITKENALQVGDKVIMRIEVRADRDMEYVHLKDMRAACFEPVNVLSGYRYQGGLGYYESTRDVSTNFFFDYLRRGTYVLEYPVFVSQAGEFSNGISTIQSMYAPEFSAHSEGVRVTVE